MHDIHVDGDVRTRKRNITGLSPLSKWLRREYVLGQAVSVESNLDVSDMRTLLKVSPRGLRTLVAALAHLRGEPEPPGLESPRAVENVTGINFAIATMQVRTAKKSG